MVGGAVCWKMGVSVGSVFCGCGSVAVVVVFGGMVDGCVVVGCPTSPTATLGVSASL